MPENVSILFVFPSGSDGELAIEKTQQSVGSQTYPSPFIQVIKVQYVSSSPGAQSAALNAAREEATGRFVVQAEPGLAWDGNKIERQVERMQSKPSAAACVHWMTTRNQKGQARVLDFSEIRAYGCRIGCLLRAPWGSSAAMLRRDVVSGLGVYRNIQEALWEYSLRLVSRGHSIDLLDEDLAVWEVDSEVDFGIRPHRLVSKQIRYPFLKTYLDRSTPEALFEGRGLVSEEFGLLVLAGLYQKNDDLEASYSLCQGIGNKEGLPESSYWRGIVYRRKPDFLNARGWFKKVKDLGVLNEIDQRVSVVLQRVLQMPEYGKSREVALQFLRHLQSYGTWDPIYFSDLCEACVTGGKKELNRLLEEVQEVELSALFDWTYRRAIGR